jgi:hypothetical protein
MRSCVCFEGICVVDRMTCRTIFCKQWYSASTFEDELYDAQKTCALEFDFAGGCCSAIGS